MVRAVRVCALRRRAGPHLGHARCALDGAELARGGEAEGVVLRPALADHRGHQIDRGSLSWPRRFHDPLGRGAAAARVHRAVALVRARGHARLQPRLTKPPWRILFRSRRRPGPIPANARASAKWIPAFAGIYCLRLLRSGEPSGRGALRLLPHFGVSPYTPAETDRSPPD